MKIRKTIFVLCVAVLSVTSCRTRNDIEYMQNIEQLAEEASIRGTHNNIQPGDEITILVTAKDLGVAAPFNQGTTPSSSRVTYSQASGNNSYSNQSSLTGFTYTVSDNGTIDFPILGKISTSGKSLEDLKEEVRKGVSRYIINPTVSAKYANYKITVLGEVSRPGQYIIPDGKVRLLDALGMAGDLTIYGKRDRVLVVREQDGVRTNAYVDLTNADFVNSPYYYLKQNDVIAVAPNKARQSASSYGPQTNVYISIASVTLGLLGLLVTVFKK
ncbi:polysaccharide biosynthesis/export family protein [Riemerella columbina]|uniref:polysaccharide biosynthesis/export family protein n=1 Tax=Riemerella columbina TaxID=103810 RepID=UPI00266EADDA|nr:polysaccharide biosynthesis/export family protein [Riemerella columbina]WKS94944.1 polysaccharide biosynthesis/export family protein [Riemerella columbina]